MLTYKCGKCTNIVVSARRGMFGLCNEVLEIGVTLVKIYRLVIADISQYLVTYSK